MPDPTPKKKLPDDVRSLARAYTHMGVKVLAGIAENGTSEPARVAAAVALLDRGWGKPKQDNTDALTGEIRVTLRKMLEDDDE
jgi:hypothetical protein